MSGCIVGLAHSKFGKHEGRDIESLIVEVTETALADAGVGAADIDRLGGSGARRVDGPEESTARAGLHDRSD